MMDLTKLIDLLPYYFKENDTYKDAQGKGILERFLEICGNYLEEQVVANIESLLDNLDVENCPEHFLSYFWEWFGCIPFAEGDFIDPDKWAQYYNGFDSKETYEEKKHHWTFNDPKNPLPLTIEQKRRILKYAISLLKCRGSKTFFETMFRLYGVEVISITDGVSELENGIPTTVPLLDDELLSLDSSSMDEQQNCMQCIPVYFNLKYTGDHFDEFNRAITNFINKYIPFNAHPIIKFEDGEGESLVGGDYYIRLTNLQTGESLLEKTNNYSGVIHTWDWSTNNGFQLYFRVEVWSDEDPEGKNSTWFYSRIENVDGQIKTTVSPQYNNGVVKIIQESFANGLTFNFYNYQAWEIWDKDPDDQKDPNKLATIPIGLNTYVESRKNYSLDIEIWENNQLVVSNPLDPQIIKGKEVRVYARSFLDNPSETTNVGITISPSVGFSLNNDDPKNPYYVLNIEDQGKYKISIAEQPTISRLLNVLVDTPEYKLRCVNDRGLDISNITIPAGSGQSVKIYVLIEPVDKDVEDYSEVLGSYIRCINTNTRYQVSQLEFGYGIEFTTSFIGIYQFQSLYNENIDDRSLWAFIRIDKAQTSTAVVELSPSSVKEIELQGTENTPSLRTVRYDISLILQGVNYGFSPDNPSLNGLVYINIYDTLTSDVLSANRKAWWGDDIDEPKEGLVIFDSDTKAHFDIEIPYVNDPSGVPYSGVIQVIYEMPSASDLSTDERRSNTGTILAKYTPIVEPIEPWVAIVPFDYLDTNWQTESGDSVDWADSYPQNPNGVKQTKLVYLKRSKEDVCKFTLEYYGYSIDGYTQYDLDTGKIIQEVTDVDVEQVISFSDLGKYVFDVGESGNTVEITVKDNVKFGEVIVDPTEKEVITWPFNESLDIHFTAWNVREAGNEDWVKFTELSASMLTVGYRKKGSSDALTNIVYANPTGARWNLFHEGDDNSNKYYIVVQGLTLNEDTEIVLVPSSNPTYRNGYDTFSITKSPEPIISTIQLDEYSEDSIYPGVSQAITGTINMSNGTTVTYDDWINNYRTNTKVFLDGSPLTYVESDPGEGEWTIASSSNSLGILVYLTKETSQLNISISSGDTTVESNVITITASYSMEDIVTLMYTTEDPSENEWGDVRNPVTIDRVTLNSNYSDFFWLCGGYDGEDYNYEPNDEPYRFESIPDGVTLECWDTGSAVPVNIGTEFTGVHRFRILDTRQQSLVAVFTMVNYRNRSYRLILRDYLEPIVKTEIRHIVINIGLQNNLVEGPRYRITIDNLFFRLLQDSNVLIPYDAEDWTYPESMVLENTQGSSITIKGDFDDISKYPQAPQITSWRGVKLEHISATGFGRLVYNLISGTVEDSNGYIDLDGPRSEHLYTWNNLNLNQASISLPITSAFNIDLEYTDWNQSSRTITINLTVSVTN